MKLWGLLALCVIAALIAVILASHKREFAFAAAAAAGIIIIILLLSYISPHIEKLSSLFDATGIESGYFSIIFKALGISLITQFASDICRDFGQTSLASKAEFIGKCAIFILSVPLLENILTVAITLIGEI